MKKKCAFCGAEFEPGQPCMKYCSPECRKGGERQKRKEWEARTDFNGKRREARKLEKAQNSPIQPRKQMPREILGPQPKRETGKAPARPDCYSRKYWNRFQDDEIHFAESMNRISQRTVNGISVYDPEFSEKVIESIKKTGVIFSTVL